MERPLFKPVGTPIEALDTPSLLIDLAALEHNIETVHGFFRDRPAKLRPHVEAHRCPAIAHRQLAAGGTVGGISVGTVGQAEVFAAAGIDDIAIANQVVTAPKIERLSALARRARVAVAVDDARNLAQLSEAAVAAGVEIGVLVEVDTRLGRCGVAPGAPVLALAERAAAASNLDFRGLASYEGPILDPDVEARTAETRACVEKLLDSRALVERAGIEVEVVSLGASHNYEIVGAMDGVSEVPAGAYALMDGRYQDIRAELRPAAHVLASVVSRPEPGVAITDAGVKAVGMDAGPARLERILGLAAAPTAHVNEAMMSAEHGELNFGEALDGVILHGSKALLVPSDAGMCANLHDFAHAHLDGRLEAVWDISACGRYR